MTPEPGNWTPERRDHELHRIGSLTTAIVVASVGITAAFGAGIAWDDAHTAAAADASTTSTTTTPPGSAPSGGTATPPTSTQSGKSPKSKSGGS